MELIKKAQIKIFHIICIAKDNKCSVEEIVNNKELLHSIDLNRYVSNEIGLPTLTDIVSELDKPGRDPRSRVEIMEFDERVKSINDLSEGMVLNGIVNNITAFGAFVDIGIKENGLVHISQLCDHFVSSPSEILKVHQHVKVKVIEIDHNRNRIALTMKGVEQ